MCDYLEYFENEFFNDIELVSGINNNTVIKSHKIILSKESEYLKNEFLKNPKLKRISLKKPISPWEQIYSQDYTKNIIKFLYTEKNWENWIEAGLNKENYFAFFSLFDSLDIIKAKLMVEEYIICNFLKKDNCIDFIFEGINLNSTYIINKCLYVISKNIQYILKINFLKNKLMKLPIDYLLLCLKYLNYEINKSILLFLIEYLNYNDYNKDIFNIFKYLKFNNFDKEFLVKIFNDKIFDKNKDIKIFLLNKILKNFKTNENNTILDNIQIKNLNFNFEYNFDNNGIFYYLGTSGIKKNYVNPSQINLVNIISSSTFNENCINILNKNKINFQTDNIKNSNIIIDMNEDKYLIPYYYSIRNYNFENKLISWEISGSIDNSNWYLIDQRKEKNYLEKLENTYTIHINNIDYIKENYIENFIGFRYLKLEMKELNSDNNYKWCISNIEFYGVGIGKGWFKFIN